MKRSTIYLSFFALTFAFASCTTTVKKDEANLDKMMKALQDSIKTAAASASPDDPANSPVYTLEEGELDSLRTWVRDDIQESYRKTPEQSHINILTFTLHHEEGNRYKGSMKTEEDGNNFTYDVVVAYDGDKFTWEVK